MVLGKNNDIFSGQGWFSTLTDFDGLMGRGMLGLVYCGDGSATMGNVMHEESSIVSGYVCNRFFSIGKMISGFCKLFGRYQVCISW